MAWASYYLDGLPVAVRLRRESLVGSHLAQRRVVVIPIGYYRRLKACEKILAHTVGTEGGTCVYKRVEAKPVRKVKGKRNG